MNSTASDCRGNDDSGSPPRPASRHHRFGTATATFVVVSSMVGTGVLTTSGFTVEAVGSNQLMLLLWVIGGILALCGALTLSELAAAMPHSGGEYVYLTKAYGPLMGFLSGWVSFLIGFGGPIAATAAAAVKYLTAPFALDDPTASIVQPMVASLAIIVLSLIHSLGRLYTIRSLAWMTLAKLGILVFLAVGGLAVGWGRWSNLADRPPLSFDLLLAMGSSLVYISYAYTGWNAAAYLAGEIDEPQRRMPRAILLGTGLVMLLYVALNVVYALALSATDIREMVATSDNVNVVAPIAQIAASRLFGVRIADPLSLAIGLTLLSSTSAFILTGPRIAYAMAQAGHFPKIAARLSSRGVPVLATVIQVSWSMFLLWTASFEWILLYSSVGLALFSMLSVSCVFVLRWRHPEMPRPFVTPGYPIVPAVYLIGTGLLSAAVIYERPAVSTVSLLSILAGVPAYFAYSWRARGPGIVVSDETTVSLREE